MQDYPLTLYRGMKADQDGLPRTGDAAWALGVRQDMDVPVVDSLVAPSTGGMSTSDDPLELPPFRRPPVFGGTARSLVMFRIRTPRLSERLAVRRDDPQKLPHHYLVEPSARCAFEFFVRQLTETRPHWVAVP